MAFLSWDYPTTIKLDLRPMDCREFMPYSKPIQLPVAGEDVAPRGKPTIPTSLNRFERKYLQNIHLTNIFRIYKEFYTN